MDYSWTKKFISVAGILVMLAAVYGNGTYMSVSAAENVTENLTFENYDDGEDLFLKYTEEQLGFDLDPSDDGIYTSVGSFTAYYGNFGNASTSTLNSNEKIIYEKLKTKIISTAGGSISDTTFVADGFSLSGGDVNSAVTGNISHMKIMKYLLADMPYELYWFDKTKGIKLSWSASQSNGKYTVSSITFNFFVSKDYSVDAKVGTTLVDTSKTSAVSSTASRARAVVNSNSGKSDFEKLVAYKNYLCDNVSYNHAAVNFNAAYGDPWQLIYAFDGDASTNIVCEGYSKAFQYLCDLSSFSSSVTCKSVTGTMDGEAHMWNIVTIGGKNYLVDITNCDDGTIGDPDQLFFKGMIGSVSGGYSRKIGTKTIKYIYDNDSSGNSMKGIYGEAALTLSSVDYYDGESTEPQDPGTSSGNQNPSQDPVSPSSGGNTSVSNGKEITGEDDSYCVQGIGTVEGYVDTQVIKVVLPVKSLDFVIDPQGLIKNTDAVRYGNKANFDYGSKEDGFVFFFNGTTNNVAHYSQSIYLPVLNKSSVPVKIKATAEFKDTSGKVSTASSSNFTDKNTSIFFNVTDFNSNQSTVLGSSQTVLQEATLEGVNSAYSVKYDKGTYVYTLDDDKLIKIYGSTQVPEYGFSISAACNPNADWTAVNLKSSSLTVTWNISKAS